MKPSHWFVSLSLAPLALLGLAAASSPAARAGTTSTSLLLDVVEVAADGGRSEAQYTIVLGDDSPAELEAHGPSYSDKVEARVQRSRGELPLLHLALKRSREREGCELRLSTTVKERTQLVSLALGRGRRLEVYATVR